MYLEPLIITLAAVRPSSCSFDNFVIVPTTRADPDRRLEGGLPLVIVIVSRVIVVVKFPRRCPESVAAVHIWKHGLLSVIPGGESGTLDRILPKEHLPPALAAAVGFAWPWPGAVTTARVELILVISVITNVPPATLPVHGVIGRVT